MQRFTILWADDEIDLLKPHLLFLAKKGYDVTPVNSGADAIDKVQEENFDIIFLDENMPGMSGLEALAQIKTMRPHVPVIMITKSEEEHLMEEAIGAKIADYLIKPVNPNQILLSVKKILDKKRIISEKTNQNYRQDFMQLNAAFGDNMNHEEWADLYKKLVFWELEIENAESEGMVEVLQLQKDEANSNFADFISRNYESWLNNPNVERPILSHQLFRKKVFPLIQEKPMFLLLIDNLRYDQWKILEPIISDYYHVEEESTYYSILPTTTAYARNAIFSGMMPLEMEKMQPDLWVGEDEDDGKNNSEKDFLRKQLNKHRLDHVKMSYNKVLNNTHGKAVVDSLNNLMHNQFNVVVYNFVDMLSHARTDTEMVRELAPDESAYRTLTKSWFIHSPLLELIKRLAEKQVPIVITTDHGTICTKRPHKIVGDKNTNSNLRYKQGKNLDYDKKNVIVAKNPEKFFLPKVNMSSSYVFATQDFFFAYPNNYNHYVKYYKDTFQHGGVSMEEMIIPFIHLEAK